MEIMKQNLALAVNWLLKDGITKLRSSLNKPYFFKEFDAFQTRATSDLEYTYSLIVFGGINFRLLTILRALDENTTIKCRVICVSIDDHPTYDALSHT